MTRSRIKTFFLLYSILILAGCVQDKNDQDYVIVGKGIKIPIDGCVEANKMILGNAVNSVAFCKCLIPKFYKQYENDPAKLKLLLEGKFDKAVENGLEDVGKLYDECVSQTATTDSTATINITPRMESQIRQGIKTTFAGTEFEQAHDLDKYCDCLIAGMQTELTARQIMGNDSVGNIKMEKLRNQCAGASLKK
ncbi:MAG: hypothetical protein ABI685_03445 [Ferruginibacter sp.]